jgi:DNA cross-link repair 1C protein
VLTILKIHVDQYKFGLFKALRGGSTPTSQTQSALSYDASVLAGYKCGNREHPGILTLNENVRLHSCEKGTGCQTVNNSNIVWIRPIITRIDGEDVNEMGIGGGGGDLQQQRELEIEDVEDVQKLMNL